MTTKVYYHSNLIASCDTSPGPYKHQGLQAAAPTDSGSFECDIVDSGSLTVD